MPWKKFRFAKIRPDFTLKRDAFQKNRAHSWRGQVFSYLLVWVQCCTCCLLGLLGSHWWSITDLPDVRFRFFGSLLANGSMFGCGRRNPMLSLGKSIYNSWMFYILLYVYPWVWHAGIIFGRYLLDETPAMSSLDSWTPNRCWIGDTIEVPSGND